MDVRIGVTYSAKELEVELADGTDRDSLVKDIEGALSSSSMVWLTDRRGRSVGVPADKVAYVEIGGRDDRRVGFGVH